MNVREVEAASISKGKQKKSLLFSLNNAEDSFGKDYITWTTIFNLITQVQIP